MSVSGPLGASPQSKTAEITARALSGRRRAGRRAGFATPTWAALGLGGVLVCALVLAVGAAGTDTLLPESVRPVPRWLAGPFGASGLHLGIGVLVALFTVMFAAYVICVRSAGRLSPRLTLMAIAAVHAIVLLAPPLLSTDVFSYQAYARIWAVYGANPYLQGPHAIALDPLYPFVGAKWVSTPSAYGPLFTALSFATAHLSIAASTLAYKAIAAVASLSTVALVWNCARLRGLDPTRAVVIVAMNPLVVVYGVGGGHNDLLMLALMMAGVYAFLAHRDRLAGVMPVLAAAVKLTGGLFLPFALVAGGGLGAPRRRKNLLLGAGATAIVVAGFGFAAFGSGQLHLLGTLQQTQSEGDWHSIPGFISTALGLGTIGRITGMVLGVAFIAVFLWLLREVWRGELDPLDAAGWSSIALLITAGSILPWYVAWLMPFTALATDRRLWRATVPVIAVVQVIVLIGYLPHNGPFPRF